MLLAPSPPILEPAEHYRPKQPHSREHVSAEREFPKPARHAREYTTPRSGALWNVRQLLPAAPLSEPVEDIG